MKQNQFCRKEGKNENHQVEMERVTLEYVFLSNLLMVNSSKMNLFSKFIIKRTSET